MNSEVIDWFSLNGRHALVTGGSRGIGHLIATGLLMAGAEVAICARKAHEVEAATRELGRAGHCIGMVADLSVSEGRKSVASWLAQTYTSLDILVNNAGTSWGEDLDVFPENGFQKVLHLNVTSVFDLTRMLLPLMDRAATPGRRARIVNIGSVDGLRVPAISNYPYSASKAAIHMLTRHLARDLLERNINVNCIAPGVFPTKMTAHWFNPSHASFATRPKLPMDRPGGLVDIAAAVVYLSAQASDYVTGVVLPVAGGIATTE